MIGIALIAFASVAVVQVGATKGSSPDEASRDAFIAKMDGTMPTDGEALPYAASKLYTKRDVCSVLKAAYSASSFTGPNVRPRSGEWHQIPFLQINSKVYGH